MGRSSRNLTGERDKIGCTPLHQACIQGHTDTAAVMIRAGADINIKNNVGRLNLYLLFELAH
jgi:ankyrin repeat protein